MLDQRLFVKGQRKIHCKLQVIASFHSNMFVIVF